MASYFTLVVEEGYLKNFGPLSAAPTEGRITQDDLDNAEQEAFDEINGFLSADYDITTWEASPPPIIARIGNLLGSANAWMMRHSADSMGTPGNPQGLRDWALKTIESIKDGEISIVTAGGTIQRQDLGDANADMTA